MNIPWCESIYFYKELKKRSLSPQQKQWAREFHDNGIIVLKNAFDAKVLDATVEEIRKHYDSEYNKKGQRRISDLWKHNNEAGKLVRSISVNTNILELLSMLYDREVYPFQTLNFKWGSEQRAHSDCIHFNSLPERFMSGVWVALEDTSDQNGTIYYYPGSHKLSITSFQDIIECLDEIPQDKMTEFYVKHYEQFIEDQMDYHGLQKVTQPLEKGDAVIWAANMVHGGGPINDENTTRWSQVTHYYYKDCLYYTPLLSNTVTGDYQLNTLQNIVTGENIEMTYNGQQVPMRPMENDLYNISKRVDSKLGKFDIVTNNPVYRMLSKLKK